MEATGALLDALREERARTVSLGLASGTPGTEDESVPSRWFTFCAGLGFDASVIGRVEQQRERGKRSTHALYLRQVVRQFLGETNRRHGTITLERPGEEPVEDLVLSIICNTSPWTYLGNRPVYASPEASFETALDVLGLRRLYPRGGPVCHPVAHFVPGARASRQARGVPARSDRLHLAFEGPLPSRWTETTSGCVRA